MASNFQYLFKAQVMYMDRELAASMEAGQPAALQIPKVRIVGRRRNGFANLCHCATAEVDDKDELAPESDWDPTYDRLMP